MSNRTKVLQKFSEDDIQCEPKLHAMISLYNRRLTRKLSTCRMQVVSSHSQKLIGGIKVNFKVADPVMIRNEINFGQGRKEVFLTKFRFKTKSILVLPATSSEDVKTLLAKFCEKLNIIEPYAQKLGFYEREITFKHHEVFYRKISEDEHPLVLSLLWGANQEKRSFVIADHDPSAKQYDKLDLDQLARKLDRLSSEEQDKLNAIRDKYEKFRELLAKALTAGNNIV